MIGLGELKCGLCKTKHTILIQNVLCPPPSNGKTLAHNINKAIIQSNTRKERHTKEEGELAQCVCVCGLLLF